MNGSIIAVRGLMTSFISSASRCDRWSVRSDRGHRGLEEIGGPAPAERLARPMVDLDGDAPELLNGVDAQVGALGEVVAQ
jgi:hypothetical protein